MSKNIRTLIDQTIEAYKIKPINIVSDFNREADIKNDYQGRQIFELMQNADDQFINDEDCDVKVKFEVTGNRFIIQNSGKPFDIDGIESLMNPHASPKKLRLNTIGHKGLGFRSVLNWANSLRIITGNFAVEFNKEYASQQVEELLKNENIFSQIKNLFNSKDTPSAILSFPKEIAERITNSDYSTKIELDLFPEFVEKIKTELNNLDFRELLFLKHIFKVAIKIDNEQERIIERIADNESIYIIEKTGENKKESIWAIYTKNDQIDDKAYEFTIAYCNNADIQNELRNKGVLYSFFKTDLQMPFPFIVHATLDLTSDRNGLQKESQYNKKLMDKLVIFIGKTAKSISENSKKIDYEPLKLLLPNNNIDNVLEENFDFSVKLKKQIESLKIFPTIENKYISLNDNPKYCIQRFDEIVKPHTFNNLLKKCDDAVVARYLGKNLFFYSESETARLIDNDADDYSNSEKISLIKLFIEKFMPYSNSTLKYAPRILCDYEGDRITDDSKVFNNPDKHFQLPEWAKMKFINPDFENKIKSAFSLSTGRQLVDKLSAFNCEEYSFDRILRQIISQAGDDKNKIKDLIKWLYDYWQKNDNKFDSVFSNIDIRAIDRNNEIVKCSDCYLGIEYNNAVGENVLKVIDAKFLSAPQLFYLDNNMDIESYANFFIQLGVSEYPRIKSIALSSEEKDIYISSNKKFRPNLYSDYNEVINYNELYIDNSTIIRIDSIEKIKEILSTASMTDIILWVLSDDKLRKTITSANEISDTSVLIGNVCKKVNTRRFDKKNLASYLRMIFQNQNWIAAKSGHKVNVYNCTIEDTKLNPLIETLTVDYESIKKTFDKNMRKQIELFFEELGVAQDFTKLSKEKIYEIFLKIPFEQSIEMSVCRSIYNQFNLAFIASEIESSITSNNIKYNEFKRHGQVLCNYKGELVFKPVNTVYYANNKVYSDEILSRYPILALNRRQGEQKICKAFCVKPIKEIGDIKVTPVIHEINDEFQKEYRLLLPYIYAKRIGRDRDGKELRDLKKSNVILVSSAETECKIDGELIKGILKDYELIQAKSENENTAYIKIPQEIKTIDLLKKELRFCETLSELFTVFLNVESDKPFFSQLIGASKMDRDFLYKSDGDINLTTLHSAKDKFVKDINYKNEFWSAIARVAGEKENEFNYAEYLKIVEDDFDYKELCKENQPQVIIQLFKKLNIDVCDYNQTAYSPIYLQEYYKKIYINFKEQYGKSGQKLSHECWRLDTPNFENSVNLDIEELFKKQIEKLEEEQRKKSADIPDKENVPDEESDNLENEEQGIEGIKKRIEEQEASGIQTVDITKEDISNNTKRTTGTRQKYGVVDSRRKERNGFVGEFKVYRELKQMQAGGAIKAFEWISGNAVKGDIIRKNEARDGAGYDFEVSFDGIRKIYIEVKSSSQNGIVFDISKNEIDFAKDHKDSYHIYFVPIIDDSPQQPKDLGCIFNFDEEEDFFSNNKFSVENNSFIVRAKVKEIL